MSRPRRLDSFDYRGPYAYSLTFCTYARELLFSDARAVRRVERHMMRTAAERDFALLAYTFMPDHLHLLVQGQTDHADLRRFCKVTRQRGTFAMTRGRTIWEDGFFEHTLRADEDVDTVARYIANNPVRAGLVERAEDWPFSGGLLLEAMWDRSGRRETQAETGPHRDVGRNFSCGIRPPMRPN